MADDDGTLAEGELAADVLGMGVGVDDVPGCSLAERLDGLGERLPVLLVAAVDEKHPVVADRRDHLHGEPGLVLDHELLDAGGDGLRLVRGLLLRRNAGCR